MNKRREEITEIYNERLNPEFKSVGVTKCLLRYPILLSNPGVVMQQLKVHKYICGRWYNSIVFPIHKNLDTVGYINESCPRAESITKGILNLPTNIDLTNEDAIEIANIVNENAKSFKFSN